GNGRRRSERPDGHSRAAAGGALLEDYRVGDMVELSGLLRAAAPVATRRRAGHGGLNLRGTKKHRHHLALSGGASVTGTSVWMPPALAVGRKNGGAQAPVAQSDHLCYPFIH